MWIQITLIILLVIIAALIYDCKIHLGNIARLLFEEQAKQLKREYNEQVWGDASGPPASMKVDL